MSEDNVYLVRYTDAGMNFRNTYYGENQLGAKVRSLRERTGFPFFSCKIAVCNSFGDEAKAEDMLKAALSARR